MPSTRRRWRCTGRSTSSSARPAQTVASLPCSPWDVATLLAFVQLGGSIFFCGFPQKRLTYFSTILKSPQKSLLFECFVFSAIRVISFCFFYISLFNFFQFFFVLFYIGLLPLVICRFALRDRHSSDFCHLVPCTWIHPKFTNSVLK